MSHFTNSGIKLKKLSKTIKPCLRKKKTIKPCPNLYCFSRVSEGTLGTFWARFWSVLDTKLGGVSAFRLVAMSRAESDRTRQDGYPKGRQKFFFF